MVHRLASSHHNENRREIVMATPSYRERMKAARAEASAQRKAEQASASATDRATVRKSSARAGSGEGWDQAKGTSYRSIAGQS